VCKVWVGSVQCASGKVWGWAAVCVEVSAVVGVQVVWCQCEGRVLVVEVLEN